MGSPVAPCDNVVSVQEAYQTKLQAALGIPATSAREEVRKAAALGVLTGLDENGCFDDLDIHGYNTLAKLGADDKNKKMEAQEDGEALSAMAKPLGDAKDQFKIALYFFNKEDGDKGKNEQKAGRWFRRAAMQGDSRAQWNLGYMHFHGIGVVNKDPVVAELWLQTAKEELPEAPDYETMNDGYFYGDEEKEGGVLNDLKNARTKELLAMAEQIDVSITETDMEIKACDRCKRDCHKKMVPKKALINDTYSGTVPKELRDLNEVETSMVSIYTNITILKMLAWSKEGQPDGNWALKGSTFAVVNDVPHIAEQLPRRPDARMVTYLRRAGTSPKKHVYFRPAKVIAALKWLVQHNLIYFDMWEAGDVDYAFFNEEYDEDEDTTTLDLNDDEDEELQRVIETRNSMHHSDSGSIQLLHTDQDVNSKEKEVASSLKLRVEGEF